MPNYNDRLDEILEATLLQTETSKGLSDEVVGKMAAVDAQVIESTNTMVSTIDTAIVESKQDIVDLQNNQQSGVMVYQTKALLDVVIPTEDRVNGSFKVSNDTDTNLNGYYSWNGSSFSKDVSLVTGVIDKNNTMDAVSGAAVYLQKLADPTTFNCFSRYGNDDLSRLSEIWDSATGTIRGEIYSAFKSIVVYGVDPSTPLKINKIWTPYFKPSTGATAFLLSIDAWDGTNWGSLFTLYLTDPADNGHPMDEVMNMTIDNGSGVRLDFELDLTLLPEILHGYNFNPDEPDMIISSSCYRSVVNDIDPTNVGLPVSGGAVYKEVRDAGLAFLSSQFLTGGVLVAGSALSFTSIVGKYIKSTGEQGTFSTLSHTTYIPVIVGHSYIVTATIVDNMAIAFYNKVGVYVASIDADTFNSGDGTIIIPTDAEFMRVSYRTAEGLKIVAGEDIIYRNTLLELNKANDSLKASLFNKELIFGGVLLEGTKLNVTSTMGSYINSVGNVVEYGDSLSYTMYTPVISGMTYRMGTTLRDDLHLAFYNKELEFIASMNGDAIAELGNILTVPPTAAYIRSSFYTVNGFSLYADEDIVYPNEVLNISALEEIISLGEVIDVSAYENPGHFLNAYGGRGNSEFFTYVSLPVIAGDTFYIKGTVVDDARLHDANGTIYPSSEVISREATTDTVCIEKDGILHISYRTSSEFKIKKLGIFNNVANLVDSKLEGFELAADPTHYKSMHRRMLCLGDSLTHGSNYKYNRALEECYPYYLNLQSRWVTTNAGYPGYAPIQIWNEHIDEYNGLDYDGCILWLGTNNGLTDTIVEDTASNDYLNYADTETGRYCSIIEKLLADNVNLKLYFFSVFASEGNLTITNSVISQLADKYGGYYIECNPNSVLYPAPEIHKYNSVHFDKIGNEVIAHTFMQGILTTIHNNIQDYDVDLYGARTTKVFDNC